MKIAHSAVWLGTIMFALTSLQVSATAEELKTKNQVVRVSHSSILPKRITVDKRGSSVYFFNDTKDSLMNLDVVFDDKLGFCATGDMRMNATGVFQSTRPIPPKNFVAVCFAHVGKYPVRAQVGNKVIEAFVEVIDG